MGKQYEYCSITIIDWFRKYFTSLIDLHSQGRRQPLWAPGKKHDVGPPLAVYTFVSQLFPRGQDMPTCPKDGYLGLVFTFQHPSSPSEGPRWGN